MGIYKDNFMHGLTLAGNSLYLRTMVTSGILTAVTARTFPHREGPLCP